MNFHERSEWISEYLDRCLPERDMHEAERHLSSCPECRRELAGLRQTRDLLRSFQPHPAAADGLADRIVGRIGPARRSWRPRPHQLALAAMVLITAVVCFRFLNEPQPLPPPPVEPESRLEPVPPPKLAELPRAALPPRKEAAPARMQARKEVRADDRTELKKEGPVQMDKLEQVPAKEVAADENRAIDTAVQVALSVGEAGSEEASEKIAMEPLPASDIVSAGGLELREERESSKDEISEPGPLSSMAKLKNYPEEPGPRPYAAPAPSAAPSPAQKPSAAMRVPASKSLARSRAASESETLSDSIAGFLYVGYARTNGTKIQPAEISTDSAKISLIVEDPETFYIKLEEEICAASARVEKSSPTVWIVTYPPELKILSSLDRLFERSAADQGVRIEIRFRPAPRR